MPGTYVHVHRCRCRHPQHGFQAWYLQASGISTDGLLRTDIYKIPGGSHVAYDSKSQFSLDGAIVSLNRNEFHSFGLRDFRRLAAKKRWLLPETRFLLSDDEFLYPDLSRVFEAWLIPPQGSWQILEYGHLLQYPVVRFLRL